jgi:hypothetical protein
LNTYSDIKVMHTKKQPCGEAARETTIQEPRREALEETLISTSGLLNSENKFLLRKAPACGIL